MNKEKLIGALDYVSKAIEEIKSSLKEDVGPDIIEAPLQKVLSEGIYIVDGRPAESPFTELLANRLAWSYTTMHPEYKIDSQFKNLEDMVKGSKISYILKWLRRKNIEGLENFFKLSLEEQRRELQIAMCNYGDKIKEVFTKRFVQ